MSFRHMFFFQDPIDSVVAEEAITDSDRLIQDADISARWGK